MRISLVRDGFSGKYFGIMAHAPTPPSGRPPAAPSREALLVHQILSEGYIGKDIVALTRLVYVRVLFRMQKANNVRNSGEMARILTGKVLTGLLGYYFDAEEVKALLESDSGESMDAPEPPPMENRAKPGHKPFGR